MCRLPWRPQSTGRHCALCNLLNMNLMSLAPTRTKQKPKDARTLWEVMEMAVTLTVVMVPWLSAYVQTPQIMHVEFRQVSVLYTSVKAYRKKRETRNLKLPSSTWAAVTEYRIAWGLKQQTFLSPSSGGWESEGGLPAWSGSSEGPLSSSQKAVFLVCPPMVERWFPCPF